MGAIGLTRCESRVHPSWRGNGSSLRLGTLLYLTIYTLVKVATCTIVKKSVTGNPLGVPFNRRAHTPANG